MRMITPRGGAAELDERKGSFVRNEFSLPREKFQISTSPAMPTARQPRAKRRPVFIRAYFFSKTALK